MKSTGQYHITKFQIILQNNHHPQLSC